MSCLGFWINGNLLHNRKVCKHDQNMFKWRYEGNIADGIMTLSDILCLSSELKQINRKAGHLYG